MKVKVYQVDIPKDKNRLAFKSLNYLKFHDEVVNPKIYKTVFNGEMRVDDLEDIFYICNCKVPAAYIGRSMSVSDVVEIVNDEGNTEIYYCDAIGFKKLEDFDSTKVEPLVGKRMIVIEPGGFAYEAIVGDDYKSLQKVVDGLIEFSYPFDDSQIIVVCNEEGKLIGLEGNRIINDEVYVGNILICVDDNNSGIADLSDEQVNKYKDMLYDPEYIQDEDIKIEYGFYNI